MSEERSREFLTASQFEAAMNERAHRLGLSVKELREHDKEILRQASNERRDCLEPFEVEMFFSGELPEERMTHGVECPECAALLTVAHSGDEPLSDFINACRALQAETPDVTNDEKQSYWAPLIDLAATEAPIVAGLLCLAFAAVVWPINDVVLDVLLSHMAIKFGAITITMIVLSVAIVLLSERLIFNKGNTGHFGFAQHGGALVGSVCTLIAVFALGNVGLEYYSRYNAMKIGENLLVQASTNTLNRKEVALMEGALGSQVAMSFISSDDDNYVSATSAKYAGKLVAQRNADLVKLYWKLGKDNKEIGTVHTGVLRIDGNKATAIISEGKEYSVDSNLIENLKNGDHVAGIVSSKTDKISKVISLGAWK